jgi:hypothetical protein
MMTIEEIERACAVDTELIFPAHGVNAPHLILQRTFYPLGFPVEVHTNSERILSLFYEAWNVFDRRFNTDPVRVDVHLVANDSMECPPEPSYRLMQSTMVTVSDQDNYSLYHLGRNWTQMTVSSAALGHEPYIRYFFLEASAICHLVAKHLTPVHAACVSLEGSGVLLCGDSGAGKSSLSYACARDGWTFTSDDATYLLNDDTGRTVTGNCHSVRLRPTASELFPEIDGLPITPRAAGKPSIEIPTAKIPHMLCAQNAEVDFIVFLNRRLNSEPQLRPYSKEVARQFMRQIVYDAGDSRDLQYASFERILTAEVLELQYTDMAWATDRLRKLVRERC